ncbi:hypothetical protein U2F10_02765 [Leptothoe sp. EHU-05/26/07-4]
MSSFLHLGLGFVSGLFGSGGPQLWTPAQISPYAWYQPGDLLTDTSGNNRNFVAVGGVIQGPTFISLDGIDGGLSIESGFNLDLTYYIVWRLGDHNPSQPNGRNQLLDSSTSSNGMVVRRSSPTTAQITGRGGSFITATYPMADQEIMLFQMQSVSGNRATYKNGVLERSDNNPLNNLTIGLEVGRTGGGHSNHAELDLYEMVIVEGAQPVDIRQNIEGYLLWNNGFQDLLPIDHPYKDSPPS